MAIVIEEEGKNSSSTALVLGWVVVLAILLVAAYYIFFAAPPAVVVTPPANFQNIAPIAQINFDPASLLNGQSFQALKEYVAEPTSTGPVPIGKANPFVQ